MGFSSSISGRREINLAAYFMHQNGAENVKKVHYNACFGRILVKSAL
jgi:hypothetical protein